MVAAPRTDAARRATALEPARSFIVQAPAGSGKTELLIQRYLVLLGTVHEPEQVVAITFTRKAAAEMRRRVVRALQAATAAEPAVHPHEARTRALARAVVERDAELDWQLLVQPQRLRIDTLDAFNAWLAQQLPVLADGVAAARIVDEAGEHYRDAARRTVGELAEPGVLGDSLRTLMQSLGNDLQALEKLLAELLPRRDQWLPRLTGVAPPALRETLEDSLRRLVDDELGRIATSWPEALLPELRGLLGHAAEKATDSALRGTPVSWRAGERPPTTGAEGLAVWRAVATLLLTAEGEWRRQLSKRQGVGPDEPAARQRLRALLAALAENELLRAALAAVMELPDPHYSEPQWRRLAALRTVLIRAAAELKVLFAEQRCVDFVELGLAARRALGQVDAPSDLLLALDRRIQHLLIDEFQDTSQSQLRLLELLTAGWQPGDGRSLFCVGDPMQSIYRFRDADMAQFLRAKRHGIGTVQLASVALESNFRSAPALVDWVNAVFSSVFPEDDQIARGAAGFYPSLASRAADGQQFVRVHALRTTRPHAEVERVVTILEEELHRDPTQSVAVLVQSRTHLAGLRERLRAKGWPVHAVEIDTLEEQPLAQDLHGLARALTHLGDRIAWLAILRAPWCGLGWTDLHALCADAPNRAVWELLQDGERLARLSADGETRALALRGALERAFAARGSASLAGWIERTWIELDGPACLDDPAELRIAEQFFGMLARSDKRADLDDPARLVETLARAQPQSDAPRESGIEIMTMHRAKGLEFDTVVLLGLGREPRADDPKALYWLERIATDGAADLLVAPLAADTADRRLTEFVRRAQRERDLAERARLLYVAATRARERLHLVCQLAPGKDRPTAHTLLAYLWPQVAPAFSGSPATADGAEAVEPDALQPVLRRLVRPQGVVAAQPRPGAGAGRAHEAARPEFAWVGEAAVHVGTVVHRHLEVIAEHGVESWTPSRVAGQTHTFRRELELLGVEPADSGRAAARVVAALTGVLEDPTGRWVLSRHRDARSELRITLCSGGRLEHVRLDRTFVDQGKRWIIDFKTGVHEGGDVETFLATEVERYRAQLDRYAAAMAAIDARPIMAALYFPLLQAFRAWPAAPHTLALE